MSVSLPNSHPSHALVLGPLEERAMERLGADLARVAHPGDLIALSGDLGAGKTTLARAFIRALAGQADLDVPSPTFTLVQTYETTPQVSHFDLYRVAAPGEVAELGVDEALEAGVALVEWPEHGGPEFTQGAISLTLTEARTEAGADARMVAIDGPNEAVERLTRSLAIRALLARIGHGEAERSPLAGDASTRRYETVHQGEWRAIVMDSPLMPDGPPVRDGKPYSRIAHLAEEIGPFVAVARILSEAGFSAPEVFAVDLDRGLAVLSDLGREPIVDSVRLPIAERYEAAIDLLAAMHGRQWAREAVLENETTHRVPDFDLGVFLIEVDLLIDWFVPRVSGAAVSGADRARWHAIWNALFAIVDAAPKTLVLRDFHSPNLLWRANKVGHDRIGLIDFQDALWGHPAYDLMSLVADARVDVPPALQARLLDRYCAARRAVEPGFDEPQFRASAAILAAQRASKILGIFVRLDERDGKPAYLEHIPRIQAYLLNALAHPALADLKTWLDARGLLDSKVAAQ